MKINAAQTYLTEAEYLAGERDREIRHELIDGQAYAMTGVSDYHNKFSGNLYAELRMALKRNYSPCSIYIKDMKVKVNQDFYYPDVMVTCDQEDKRNDYFKPVPSSSLMCCRPAPDALTKPINAKPIKR